MQTMCFEHYDIIDSRGRKVIEGKLSGIETNISIKELTPVAYLLKIGEDELPVRVNKQ